jgi:moderate conductance mechanosensitive channel
MFFADTQINQTVQQSGNALKQISDTIFNTRTLIVLVVSLAIAFILGRIIATALRHLTHVLSKQADKTDNLATVNRLRRIETLIVLSIAVIRTILVVFALYFSWVFTHPSQQSGALIGASALFAILVSGALSPILRDVAFGTVMMAEHWFGVGDFVKIEPLTGDASGVVERVTLRSTRLRTIGGEVVWIQNSSIWAVHVAPKGTRTIALEMFVTDPDKGAELIEQTNLRLSTGWLTVISPFAVMTTSEVADKLWHITAICEVALGREWLIEDHGINVMIELDERSKPPVLVHKPFVRYTDSEAEKRFTRTIKNARKQKIKRVSLTNRTRQRTARKS